MQRRDGRGHGARDDEGDDERAYRQDNSRRAGGRG